MTTARKKRLWLLLLKGVDEGEDSLSDEEVKLLYAKPVLYHTASCAAATMLGLDEILEQRKLKRLFAKASLPRLLRFQRNNERAKRLFLRVRQDAEAPTEDSRYCKLEWKGRLISQAREARRL